MGQEKSPNQQVIIHSPSICPKKEVNLSFANANLIDPTYFDLQPLLALKNKPSVGHFASLF